MKEVACVAGYLTSMIIALEPITRLFARHMYFVLNRHFKLFRKSHNIFFFQLFGLKFTFRIRGIDVFIISVYCCVSLQSPSASEQPLVSHSFRTPSSAINDVPGDPFSSTLDGINI